LKPTGAGTGLSTPSSSLRDLFFHLETTAKLLKLLKRVLADFSKCALKSRFDLHDCASQSGDRTVRST
jgi:hypothetical protein